MTALHEVSASSWLTQQLPQVPKRVRDAAEVTTLGQSVTLFGFGSQGKAQALNARDSGWKVRVYLRPESPRLESAKKAGFEVSTDPIAAARRAGIAVLLLPDAEQPRFYKDLLEANLPNGAALIFAHGFNIHFQEIRPRKDIDILLTAPFLQAEALRRHYLQKEPVRILTAVAQDATDRAYRLVEDYAGAIGGSRVEISPSTFKEETETDLFAEQVVLCGGLHALVQEAIATLVEAGYNQDIAYHCCLKELKAMAACLYQYGIEGTRKRISDVALFGDLTRGPRLINRATVQTMKDILNEIVSGQFLKEFKESHPS